MKATLKLARLTENSAERGGGLLLGNSVDLDILGDVSCVQNTAKEQGGAVRVGDSSSISGTGALFKQNDAGQGGAIYIKVNALKSDPFRATMVYSMANNVTLFCGLFGLLLGFHHLITRKSYHELRVEVKSFS